MSTSGDCGVSKLEAMWIPLLIFVCCLGASCATPGPPGFKNCSGSYQPAKHGLTTNITLDPCQVPPPCQIKKGSNATAYITFTPSVAVTSLKAIVHGKLGILPQVPFEIPNSDGCSKSNLTCPLKAGQTVYYSTVVPVPAVAPSADVEVYFELQDQTKEDVVCITFPMKIE